MYTDKDQYGAYDTCIQCGYVRDKEVIKVGGRRDLRPSASSKQV
jgi:hypothetical protein